MKTAISVPDNLFDAADRLARRLNVSRSELYQRAVREFVASHNQEGVTDALNRAHAQGSDDVIQKLREVWLDVEEW